MSTNEIRFWSEDERFHALTDMCDGADNFVRLIFIKAPSHAETDQEDQKKREDELTDEILTFIENSDYRRPTEYENHCYHAHDCCGCWFEMSRDLVCMDPIYGIWCLMIRRGQNV